MRRITLGFVVVVGLFGFSRMALGNEYTDVIDAFDDDNGDPFDIHLSVEYERFQRNSTIRRETLDGTPHNWDFYAYENLFKFKQITHLLNINVDIGIYKDLALRFRLPLVLNDTRELRDHGDWDRTWQTPSLFPTPFKSPERSGIDYFAVGLWWGILAQERDQTKPDWLIFVEGRFGVGDTMEASCSKGNIPGYPATEPDVACTNKGGVSRGLNELALGTRLSRRFGIFDPYFGFEALIGWPKSGTPFFSGGASNSKVNTMPPIVGTLDFGMEIVPFERPENNLKISIDIGATGKYHSEGREYSPLFDALGTSSYLKHPESADFDKNGVYDDLTENQTSSYSGMTDIENYATFAARLAFMVQPAKYVKFRVGTILGHESQHFITKTDGCTEGNLETQNGFTTCSEPNSDFRPDIDSPGTRFRAEKTFIWTFFVNATAMF